MRFKMARKSRMDISFVCFKEINDSNKKRLQLLDGRSKQQSRKPFDISCREKLKLFWTSEQIKDDCFNEGRIIKE